MTAAERRRLTQGFTGTVRDFQVRRERSVVSGDNEIEIWHFRIERHDDRGNRMDPVPVEMRGLTFSGSVSNGDEVHVSGRWRNGTLRVEEFTNLTTRAQVKGKSYGRLHKVALVIAVILMLAIAAFIVSNWIAIWTAPTGEPDDWLPTDWRTP
ncbi:hypothetical protein [Streptomyces subrutilus]|uniref:hypothetical protein n=1 Tax=Streptomyces subrutilus TaxID=36818 RepID=UPI00114D204C|nr:hypothetical protein [Streptomyces subrutilus]